MMIKIFRKIVSSLIYSQSKIIRHNLIINNSFLTPPLSARITNHKPSHWFIRCSNLFLALAISRRLVAKSTFLICIDIDFLFQLVIESSLTLFSYRI